MPFPGTPDGFALCLSVSALLVIQACLTLAFEMKPSHN